MEPAGRRGQVDRGRGGVGGSAEGAAGVEDAEDRPRQRGLAAQRGVHAVVKQVVV